MSNAAQTSLQPSSGFDSDALVFSEDLGFKVTSAEHIHRFSLRAQQDQLDTIASILGVEALESRIGATFTASKCAALCLGPDEWLLQSSDQGFAHSLIEAFGANASLGAYSLVDVSSRNVGFHVSGRRAAAFLNIGCPLDLSDAAFPIGKCTRTLFDQIEIIVWRQSADRFEVQMWRSFVPHFLGFLSRVAEEGRSDAE